METKRYSVKLTGETPLLMHADDYKWAEHLKKYREDPANAKKSVAGDDRTPAFTWMGYCYVENDQLVIPSDNIMTVIREGASRCPKIIGKGTYKRESQSGIVVDTTSWSLLIRGKTIPFDEIKALMDEKDFMKHIELANNLGFELFVKRARIGQSKHIRVRPRFDIWETMGTVTVLDESITDQVLENIFKFAGVYAGLGDWRPSSPKSPGPYGKFSVEVKRLS